VDLDSEGKGSDVGSAGTITLPDTANLFAVTGSTNISTVAASWKGRQSTLIFIGALTVNNGAGNLRLNGNLNTQNGKRETLTLTCDGTDWYEVGRSLN